MRYVVNFLYRLARTLDRPRTDGIYAFQFGEKNRYGDPDPESFNFGFHSKPDTIIKGSFDVSHGHLYCALNVGSAQHGVTIFLNRKTAFRILRVMESIEASYQKHGDLT